MIVEQATLSQRAPQSQQQRYRSAFHLAQRLASCAAEETGSAFNLRLEQLQALLTAWETGDTVTVNVANVHNKQTHQNNNNVDTETDTENIDLIDTDNIDNQYGGTAQSDEKDTIETTHTSHNTIDADTENIDLINTDNIDNQCEETAQSEEKNTPTTPTSQNTIDTDMDNIDIIETTDASQNTIDTAAENIDNIEEIDTTKDPNVIPTTTAQSIAHVEDLGHIVLPPNIKKRGRPKGSESTVIGLPKKRSRLSLKKKKIPFDQKTPIERATIMLKWFVHEDVASACMNYGRLVTITDITTTAETVNMAATDTNFETIYKYFDTIALQKVLEIVNAANKRVWTCSVCSEHLDTRCIGCDLCLGWFHYHCAALTAAPKSKY
ncbi:hypothetical protein ACF0H5_014251 [Mactra antiquata]